MAQNALTLYCRIECDLDRSESHKILSKVSPKGQPSLPPNLTYCQIVWHFCKASDARKLESVQERALRAVYNDRNATYEELLEKGRLSSLENRRLQDILILISRNIMSSTELFADDMKLY